MARPYKYDRVMIIDDTALDRTITEKMLQLYGIVKQPLKMDSAKEALSQLFSIHDEPDQFPELIFLDLNMPEMNGFEFLDGYATLPDGLKRKNIIVLTSSVESIDKQRALNSPYVLDFFTKPLKAEHLKTL